MKNLNNKNFVANPDVVVCGKSDLFVELVDEAIEQLLPLKDALDVVRGNKFKADDLPYLFKCSDSLFRRISAISELMSAGCYYIDVVPQTVDNKESQV